MVARRLGLKDFRVSEHPTCVSHVEQKAILEEFHGKDGDRSRQGSRLLIEFNNEQLVDEVSQGVEDGTNEVHNGHSATVHLDNEQG